MPVLAFIRLSLGCSCLVLSAAVPPSALLPIDNRRGCHSSAPRDGTAPPPPQDLKRRRSPLLALLSVSQCLLLTLHSCESHHEGSAAVHSKPSAETQFLVCPARTLKGPFSRPAAPPLAGQ